MPFVISGFFVSYPPHHTYPLAHLPTGPLAHSIAQDNHPRTPTIVTPTESNPRRVVVAEMISPVSTAQPHFNHNLNYAYAADKQAHGADDDAYGGDGEEDGGGVISDPERSVAVHGLGHKRDTSNSKRTSPILSPREAFQSPYGNRSRPRRTASDAGRGRRRPLSQAGPTATVTSAPQAHATSPQHAQLNTSTSKATLMLQLEHARAEIKRKDQAIAARDSKLAEAWLELDKKPADQEPAAVQPAVLGNAAAIDTGKTKRRKYRWMPSLGRKSKPSSKAPDAAATATALPASPPTGAATNREGDDALTWDSTAMVRYGTPVAADGESSGAIPALATGVGHGADVSMVRSEAARSFLPLENSRLSVIGPSTSIMQRAIDEAEEQDAERKLREEQATAFVEKKAAARVARTVRRTAADAPETRGGCAVAEPSGSVPTPADAGTLAGIIRGSTVAATSAQAAVAATSAPTIFGGATTRVAALAAFPGADMQATKFVPTTQSKKEARKWAAEQRKVHKQTQKLQKKQMKESARWAKEQAHIQKQESKMRAKEAKLARSQLKKAKALEAQAIAAAAASGEAGAEDVNRTGFSGTGVEDMWETDVAWKQEVAYLQAEDPAMLQEELEARNASIHERSTTSSFRGGGSPGAASEGAGGGAAVNRSMSMAAVPVARAKSKRFRWGLSFLRRSKSMRAPETAATAQSATSIAVAKAVSALDAKPKRRWSIKAKFSFLRRKRTGNAAAIAARAAEAAENAASITSGDQRRQNNYTATTTAEDTSMSTDLDSLWLSLNPHAAGHATMTEI